MDPQQDEDEGHLVHLGVVEVVEKELGRKEHGEHQREGRKVALGKGARDDLPREVDRHHPQDEVEQREQRAGDLQRKDRERLEDERRERRILERPRARWVAVVERMPRGEVVARLPEHVEVVADLLP